MEVAFEQVISRGCGIDVHKKTVVATINGEGLQRSTREFGTFTSSLTELKDRFIGKRHHARCNGKHGRLPEARLSRVRTFGNKSPDCQCPTRKKRAGTQD